MQAIIFALISYVGWGVGVFAEAYTARIFNSYSLTFWGLFLSFVVSSLYVPFVLNSLANLTWGLFLFNYIIAINGLLIGTIAYYEAMKIENRALVGMIASSFPLVTVIISILVLGERITSFQLSAMILIFLGLFLVSFRLKDLLKNKIVFSKGVLLAFLTMLMWGIYFAFIKIPVSKIGWFLPNYISFAIFPLIYLYMKFKGVKLENPKKSKILIPLISTIVLPRIAEFSYNVAISRGLVAIVAPIAGANTTLYIILAFLFFKDSIKKQQIAGIMVTLAGIVALSMLSF